MKKIIINILLLLPLTVITVQAQCYPDRHSTTWYDGWVSCETSVNPNSVYGDSHWIMYDLGNIYALADSKIWNANEPANLDFGINEYAVDISLDGQEWVNIGTFNLEQSLGEMTYEGADGPDFEDNFARFVLITPLSNYGGNCYGFGELKINISEDSEVIDEETGFTVIVYPNPFENDLNLKVVTLFDGEPISYRMHDILGRQILETTIEDTSIINYIDLSDQNLSSGLYLLTVRHNGNEKTFKLVRK